MDEVLIQNRVRAFTRPGWFGKPRNLIQLFFLLFPSLLSAQIPVTCAEQWDNFPYQSEAQVRESFPAFLDCCGGFCKTKKDSLLARAFHIKGIVFLQEDQLQEAVGYNRKALAIRRKASPFNLTDVGHSHLNLGFIFSHNLLRYQQAKKQLDSAWHYLSKGKNAELRGDCLLETANLMQKQGDINQSLLYIDQAIDNYQQHPGENRPLLIANAYLARGEIMAQLHRFKDASRAYHQALDMYVDAGEKFEEAKVLHDLGHMEMTQENWAKALSFFEQGAQLYTNLQKTYQDVTEALAYVNEQWIGSLIGIASCHTHLKNYRLAEKALQQAMAATLPSQLELRASIADNQGDLFISRGQIFPDALEAFNRGLVLLFPAFHPRDVFDCPRLTDSSEVMGQAELVLTLVEDKAKALEKAASTFAGAEKKRFLRAALQQHELADQLSFRFRQNQHAEGSRLFWQRENRSIYEAALSLCYELDEPETAFRLMENSKALVLLEALKDAVAKASAGISEEDLLAEQQLKTEISQLEARLAGALGTAEKEMIQKRRDTLSLRQTELMAAFKNRYPQYFAYTYGQWTKGAQEVQKALGKAGLIAYFEGENALYLSYLDKDSLLLAKIEKPDASLNSFMEAVKNPLLNAAMAQEGYNLYAALFQPLLDLKLPEKIYIVPDGQLTRLPFDALCSAAALVEGRPAFLLHKYTISYAYSASVLFQERRAKEAPAKNLLAMAPGQFDQLGLPPLPHSGEEVSSIVKLLGGKALLAEKATKSAFLKESQSYGVLHLSTHAAADSTGSPWIAFRDSFLYLPAIYGLQTQAHMVVLSACQTNQGKLAVGEGVMSLARAFRYAGVPAVLASMWEAEDASAAYIMDVFYQKLKAGLPKDEALSEAKRAYLADDAHYSFRSPFFWSNFVLVGDVEPLEGLTARIPGKNEVKLMLGIFLSLLIYLYFRTKNRNTHVSKS